MVLILSGCDCTGKSSVAQLLLKNFSGAQVHLIKESNTQSSEEKWKRVLSLASRIPSNAWYIYDRATILDDFVYEKLLNHQESMFEPYIKQIAALLQQCNIVYLDAPTGIISQRLVARGDEYITGDQVAAIKKKYEEIFNTLGVDRFIINAQKESPQEIADIILKYVWRKEI